MGAHRGPYKGSKKGIIRCASPLLRQLFVIADEQSWTLIGLANVLDVVPQTVGTWRLGKRAPSIMEVEALAHVLGYELQAVRRRHHDE